MISKLLPLVLPKTNNEGGVPDETGLEKEADKEEWLTIMAYTSDAIGLHLVLLLRFRHFGLIPLLLFNDLEEVYSFKKVQR